MRKAVEAKSPRPAQPQLPAWQAVSDFLQFACGRFDCWAAEARVHLAVCLIRRSVIRWSGDILAVRWRPAEPRASGPPWAWCR